jgi:hypothetical protein
MLTSQHRSSPLICVGFDIEDVIFRSAVWLDRPADRDADGGEEHPLLAIERGGAGAPADR